MSTKTFATASNARRAARDAGFTLDQVEIVQDGARFSYVVKSAPEVEAEAEAPAVTQAAGQLWLSDDDGEDYGPVNEGAATETAAALAVKEGKTIYVKNGQGFTVHTATAPAPQVEAPAPTAPAPEVDPAPAPTSTGPASYALDEAFNRLKEGLEGQIFVVSFVIGRDNEADAIKAGTAFAKKLGFEGMVRLAGASAAIIVPAKVVKAPKAPKADGAPKVGRPKSNEVTGVMKLAVDLASRPAGTTRPQMDEANGGKQQPWTMLLKQAAERLGRTLDITKDDKGRATYFLRTAH